MFKKKKQSHWTQRSSKSEDSSAIQQWFKSFHSIQVFGWSIHSAAMFLSTLLRNSQKCDWLEQVTNQRQKELLVCSALYNWCQRKWSSQEARRIVVLSSLWNETSVLYTVHHRCSTFLQTANTYYPWIWMLLFVCWHHWVRRD